MPKKTSYQGKASKQIDSNDEGAIPVLVTPMGPRTGGENAVGRQRMFASFMDQKVFGRMG